MVCVGVLHPHSVIKGGWTLKKMSDDYLGHRPTVRQYRPTVSIGCRTGVGRLKRVSDGCRTAVGRHSSCCDSRPTGCHTSRPAVIASSLPTESRPTGCRTAVGRLFGTFCPCRTSVGRLFSISRRIMMSDGSCCSC